MDAAEKGNREFGLLTSEIRGEELCTVQLASGKVFRLAEMEIRRIDLIDWTSAANQTSVDYAKPHLQLLCIPGVQISLDAFSGRYPEI